MKLSLFAAAVFWVSASVWAGNLIENPGFETPGPTPGTAAGWTRQILMPGAKAHLQTVRDQKTGSMALATWFLAPERAEGARFFQFVELQPKRVYKLSYDYRSDWDGRLSGDVMMTETGNGLYNVMNCPANTAWTKIVRYIPVLNDAPKKAGVYVQNRSMVPLWYDHISLEETEIPVQDILDSQFKLTLHPLTEKDTMLMPSDAGDITFIVQIFVPPFVRAADMVIETRVIQGKEIRRGGEFPVKLNAEKTMRFSVPSKLVAVGGAMLQVILKSADGVVYQHTVIDIERFEAADAVTAVEFENVPMLRHNGENFFPIAFYGVPFQYDEKTGSFDWGEGYYKDIKPYAYNTLQDYVFGGPSQPNLKPQVGRQKAFLDGAAREGKMVMVELPRTLVEYDRGGELEEWIRMADAHPATLYFRSEEMMHFRKTPLKYLANAAATVKKVNPERKYLVFDHLTKEMVPHIDGLDFGGVENKFLAAKWRQTVGRDRILLATVNVEWPGRNAPDMTEQRYRTFMPVIHGARGIAFFMWSIARFLATDKEYIHRIGRSVNELAEVTPALTHPRPLPEWYPAVVTEGSVSILRASDGTNHWLLAGPSYPASAGAVSFELPEGVAVEPCFGENVGKVDGRKHTFPIRPQQVLILKFRAP